MFFFFFFDNLINIKEISDAFTKICANKMLHDGYVDMNTYINAKITKAEMLSRLEREKSQYSVLYSKTFPKEDNVADFWLKNFPNNNPNSINQLTFLEAEAIVYWVYRILNKQDKRVSFTKELFSTIKDFYEIQNDIEYSNGVFYNKMKVELHFVQSLKDFDKFLNNYVVQTNKQLFFRGHSKSNYTLIPSIMRNTKFYDNENKMYNDIIINCPEEFSKCSTHLEKLVVMQHYGLPTRLLDITRNPLVALYFACESHYDLFGEIIIIEADERKIKYPNSDSVTVLSSLPLLDKKTQDLTKDYALFSENNEQFNSEAQKLLHEVRLEKPAFRSEINKEDVIDSFIVLAIKNNNRIVKQDGAFIICGLIDNAENLNEYRLTNDGKRIVLLVKNKKEILRSLNNFSINKATLFPEIDFVSDYIKNKYN